ncbi:MAG: ABC transporter ATP-binding protein [Actinobacteria bacterium]|nr:ABC transporter ATP-binding protein [Actinomycetota bacterium]
MPAITIKGLTKSYGSLQAVRGLDLEVAEGEVFALLGPNGAGKTTTVEILEGFRRRDAGEVRVLGIDPESAGRRFREDVGVVLQQTGLDPFLTVAETLEMFGGYYPRRRPTSEVIDVVGLGEKSNVRVTKLSGGQRRRLDVGIALVGDPQLLFLDEPTTGFDPGARRNAWDMVRNLASFGKTVFLTTHYMDEAQALADRVAILARGEIVVEGSPDTLAGRDLDATVVTFRLKQPEALPDVLRDSVSRIDDGFRFSAPDPTEFLHRLTGWAMDSGEELLALQVTKPSLEDVYLELTKGSDAGAAQ